MRQFHGELGDIVICQPEDTLSLVVFVVTVDLYVQNGQAPEYLNG